MEPRLGLEFLPLCLLLAGGKDTINELMSMIQGSWVTGLPRKQMAVINRGPGWFRLGGKQDVWKGRAGDRTQRQGQGEPLEPQPDNTVQSANAALAPDTKTASDLTCQNWPPVLVTHPHSTWESSQPMVTLLNPIHHIRVSERPFLHDYEALWFYPNMRFPQYPFILETGEAVPSECL